MSGSVPHSWKYFSSRPCTNSKTFAWCAFSSFRWTLWTRYLISIFLTNLYWFHRELWHLVSLIVSPRMSIEFHTGVLFLSSGRAGKVNWKNKRSRSYLWDWPAAWNTRGWCWSPYAELDLLSSDTCLTHVCSNHTILFSLPSVVAESCILGHQCLMMFSKAGRMDINFSWKRDTPIRYLLDEPHAYEAGHSDALRPIQTETDKSFMGEHKDTRAVTYSDLKAWIPMILKGAMVDKGNKDECAVTTRQPRFDSNLSWKFKIRSGPNEDSLNTATKNSDECSHSWCSCCPSSWNGWKIQTMAGHN